MANSSWPDRHVLHHAETLNWFWDGKLYWFHTEPLFKKQVMEREKYRVRRRRGRKSRAGRKGFMPDVHIWSHRGNLCLFLSVSVNKPKPQTWCCMNSVCEWEQQVLLKDFQMPLYENDSCVCFLTSCRCSSSSRLWIMTYFWVKLYRQAGCNIGRNLIEWWKTSRPITTYFGGTEQELRWKMPEDKPAYHAVAS